MTPKGTPSTMQMNLQFLNSEPMRLPQDKQRELAIALADLLLNAAVVEGFVAKLGEGFGRVGSRADHRSQSVQRSPISGPGDRDSGSLVLALSVGL